MVHWTVTRSLLKAYFCLLQLEILYYLSRIIKVKVMYASLMSASHCPKYWNLLQHTLETG